jgi:hypothetical protein
MCQIDLVEVTVAGVIEEVLGQRWVTGTVRGVCGREESFRAWP